MAVKAKEELIPHLHSTIFTFRDDFGYEHVVLEPTHIATDDPLRPFPVGPAQLKAFNSQKANIQKALEEREASFLQHCMEHPEHRTHPMVLGHPDHPINKGPK